jgi:hypothetical protein
MEPVFEILFGREYFDPLFVQRIRIGFQLLLLALHASSDGDEAPPEVLLFEGVFGEDVVLGAEALVFLGLRHVVVVGPFKEVVGI